jgi:hypothetical protein
MAVTMKNTVICVVTPYSLERSEHFGGSSPPSSGQKNKPSKKPAEADGKLKFFELEDEADMFLRNVGLSPNYQHYSREDSILQIKIRLNSGNS